jgi:hypothetical protein
MVKVDAILGCPVFESSDKDVLQIEDVLTNYYEDSVVSDTDDEDEDADEDNDADQDQDDDDDAEDDDESAVTDYMTDADGADADADTTDLAHDADGADAADSAAAVTAIEMKTELPDPEFELIDPSID